MKVKTDMMWERTFEGKRRATEERRRRQLLWMVGLVDTLGGVSKEEESG
jgi:hypothetical protein